VWSFCLNLLRFNTPDSIDRGSSPPSPAVPKGALKGYLCTGALGFVLVESAMVVFNPILFTERMGSWGCAAGCALCAANWWRLLFSQQLSYQMQPAVQLVMQVAVLRASCSS